MSFWEREWVGDQGVDAVRDRAFKGVILGGGSLATLACALAMALMLRLAFIVLAE